MRVDIGLQVAGLVTRELVQTKSKYLIIIGQLGDNLNDSILRHCVLQSVPKITLF